MQMLLLNQLKAKLRFWNRKRYTWSRSTKHSLVDLRNLMKGVKQLRYRLKEQLSWLMKPGQKQSLLRRISTISSELQWKDWHKLRKQRGTLKVWRGRRLTWLMKRRGIKQLIGMLYLTWKCWRKELEKGKRKLRHICSPATTRGRILCTYLNTVHVLDSLLESERIAHAEANNRAEALSVQLQVTQGKLDALSQEFNTLRFSDKATLDSQLRTASHVKRGRTDDYEVGIDSVHDTGTNDRANKRAKSNTSPLKFTSPEDSGSVFKGDEDASSIQTRTEDYTKLTVQKLKQELTKHNVGAELLQLRNPNKKDIVALYEKCILQKS